LSFPRNSFGGLTFGNADELGGGFSRSFLGDPAELGDLGRSCLAGLGRSFLGNLAGLEDLGGGFSRSFFGDPAELGDLGRSCLAGLGRSFLGNLAGLEDLGGLSNGFGSLSGGFGNGLGEDLDGLRGLSNASGRGLSGGLLGLGGDLNGRLGRSYGRGFGRRLRRFARGVVRRGLVPALGPYLFEPRLGDFSNLLSYLPSPVLRFAEKSHRTLLSLRRPASGVEMASTIDRSSLPTRGVAVPLVAGILHAAKTDRA
jgi:hypothetical protein